MPRVVLIVAAVTFAPSATKAWADSTLEATVGYAPLGTLSAASQAKVTAVPVSLLYGFEGKIGGANRYMLAGVFTHQFVSYEQDGATFSGSNFLAGAAVGVTWLRFASSFLRLEADYFPYNSLAVTSETEATVNGVSYKHSTLSTFTGPGALEYKVVYMTEQTGGQFNKFERLRYGVSISQLSQPISKSEVRIATSNPDIAPPAKVTEDVDYSLSLTSLGFIFGFAF